MKKIIALSLCLWMTGLWADVTDYTYSTSHTIASFILDPVDFCYPPNPPDPKKPFSSYFANDVCYYRFNNDCADAATVSFDHSGLNQEQNARFFQMCNNTDSSKNKMGPEFLFYVNAQEAVTGCIILSTNLSAAEPNQTTVSVLNQTPGSTMHAPGCNINEITVWNLQRPAPGSNLEQVQCLSITGGTRNAVATVKDLNAALTNNYKECPAPQSSFMRRT